MINFLLFFLWGGIRMLQFHRHRDGLNDFIRYKVTQRLILIIHLQNSYFREVILSFYQDWRLHLTLLLYRLLALTVRIRVIVRKILKHAVGSAILKTSFSLLSLSHVCVISGNFSISDDAEVRLLLNLSEGHVFVFTFHAHIYCFLIYGRSD